MTARKIVRRLAAAFAALLLVVALAAAFLLGTETGRVALVRYGAGLGGVALGPVASPDLGTFRLGSVAVSDADGVWLRAEDVGLEWSPGTLFAGTLRVDSASAGRIDVFRRPLAAPETEPAAETSSGFSLPIGVDLRSLAVSRLDLRAPVLGVADALSLKGRARLVSEGDGPLADGELAIERLADSPAVFNAVWSYEPDSRRLVLDSALSEPAEGTLQTLLGIRPELPVSASLRGSGTLDDWTGRFALDAGATAHAEGALTLRRVAEGIQLRTLSVADIAAAFTDAKAALFAGSIELDAAALLADNGGMRLDRLELTAPSATLSASGSLGPDGETIAATIDARIPDGSRLEPLIGQPVAFRDLTVEGTIGGTLSAPEGRVTVDLAEAAVAGIAADSIRLTAAPIEGGDGTIRIEGEAPGFRPQGQAGGDRLAFRLDGRLEDGVPVLVDAEATLAALAAGFSGRATATAVDGDATLRAADLSVLAGLTGRPLAGAVDLKADVAGNPATMAFDITLAGNAERLAVGVPQLDRLLAGRAEIAGAVETGPGTLAFDDLALTTESASVSVDGALGGGADRITADITLRSLADLDPNLSGEATATATATGDLAAPAIDATVRVPEGVLYGRAAEGLEAHYEGRLALDALAGTVTLAGRLAGVPLDAAATLAGTPAAPRVTDLKIAAASATVTGDLALTGAGLPSGRLVVAAPKIDELAALVGQPASGALNATIVLPEPGAGAAPRLEAAVSGVRFGDIVVDRLTIDAESADPAALSFSGTVDGGGIRAGGVVVESLDGTVSGAADRLGLALDLDVLDGSGRVAADLAFGADALRVALRELRFTKGGETVALAAPAELRVAGGAVSFDTLRLTAGSGNAVISGSAGTTLDLDVALNALPLGIAAIAAPGLDLSGTVSGTAEITGAAAAPGGSYRLSVSDFSMASLTGAGVDALDISAAGTLGGGRVTAKGEVGGITGAAVRFDGSAPLGAGNLDMAIDGALDLGDLNGTFRFVAADLGGRLAVDGRVTGPVAAPRFAGTVTLADGQYVDRVAGLAYTGISGSATADGTRLTLRNFSANAGNGGRITASGGIDLAAAAGPTADIAIQVRQARVIESREVIFDVNGDLRLTGPLTAMPTIAGTVNVIRLDVQLPNKMPGGVAGIDVRHVNAPADLQQVIEERARNATGGPGGSFDARLDVQIYAPGRVFIRGQGLDAELEGDIRVSGTLGQPVVLGAFELRRGSLSVLSQRLDLTNATLTFAGDLDPLLEINAETRAGDVTAIFAITGTASEPIFTISSEPNLPQDEVLARLLFNKAAGDLSAGEALALAQAAAQLAGFSTGPGFLDQLRRKTGLDRLSVSTDSEGNPVVDLGRAIGDRVFIGVQQGTGTESTRATVDIDITKDLKARGEVGADGDSRFGFTIEREY